MTLEEVLKQQERKQASKRELAELKKRFYRDVQVMKGDKGDKGESPTRSELLNLIMPLIPSPIPGKNGKNPLTISKTPPRNPEKGDLWLQI